MARSFAQTHSLLLALLAALYCSLAFADDDPPFHSLTSLCNTTTYPSLCLSTLSSFPSSQPSAYLQNLTAFVVSSALLQLNRSYSIAQGLDHHISDVASRDNSSATLQDCLGLMDESRDGLQSSVDRLSHLDEGAPPATLSTQVMDVRVWLSASLTELDTCWDELADPSVAELRARLEQAGQEYLEPLLSVALSLAQTLHQPGGASTLYALPVHYSRHHHLHHRRRRHL
ncbi:hypothetical protein L7F22_064913 [Adiantum nelumboides]|nr:hypothetical protein [Adiantum nelumboides]